MRGHYFKLILVLTFWTHLPLSAAHYQPTHITSEEVLDMLYPGVFQSPIKDGMSKSSRIGPSVMIVTRAE